MKRLRSLILFITLLSMAMPMRAQLTALMLAAKAIKDNVPVYTPGEILYRDGHRETYAFVQLPRQGLSKLKVSNEAKHAHPVEIEAIDIESVTYWHADFPEKQTTIYYLHVERDDKNKRLGRITDAWGYPLLSSPWGTVYKCHTAFTMNKKTGDMEKHYAIRTVHMGNMVTTEEVPAACLLVCPDYPYAQPIGSSYSYQDHSMILSLPKRVAPIFASCPDIEQRILDREISGEDMQYILDYMADYHNLTTAPREVQPGSTISEEGANSSQPTSYGTPGDDE